MTIPTPFPAFQGPTIQRPSVRRKEGSTPLPHRPSSPVLHGPYKRHDNRNVNGPVGQRGVVLRTTGRFAGETDLTSPQKEVRMSLGIRSTPLHSQSSTTTPGVTVCDRTR